MKKRGLILASLLSFAGVVSLASCTAPTPEVIKENATITLDFNEEYCEVLISDKKDAYRANDVISLEIKIKNNELYAFSYATLNNEKIEDVKNITLSIGENFIKIYLKEAFNQEGATNLRDFTFKLGKDDTYSITGYTPSGVVPNTLDIPSTYLGKPVTAIDFAYDPMTGNVASQYSFSLIKKVHIPSSIIKIANEVFLYGETVEEFIVDDNNPNFKAVEKSLYSRDGKTLLSAPRVFEGTFVIPSGTTAIENYAFYRVLNLLDIKFNDELESIGYRAFYGCSNIKEITLSNKITTIANEAFAYCSKLKNITLSTSLTSIETQVFMSCIKLESIEIPGSVKTIKEYAFATCSSLETITFNEGLTTIEAKAFQYVPLKEAILPSTLKTIGANAFGACEYLSKVELKEGLTSIGSNAFNICKSLSEITLPASLKTLGDGAFTACISLTKIDVKEENKNFKSIEGVLYSKDASTLIHYPNLKPGETFIIPDSVTTIGFRAFNYASNNPYKESTIPFSVKEVVIPKSVNKMINPFYGANRIAVTYLGTKEEFKTISTKATIDGSSFDWYTGSLITSVTCTDGAITYETTY